MVNIPKVNVACQCANSGTRVIYMSSSSPPHPWKRGKGGNTPHPAKGRQPLGTLLCSTFKLPCASSYYSTHPLNSVLCCWSEGRCRPYSHSMEGKAHQLWQRT